MSADHATNPRLLVVEEDPAWIAILRAALDHGGFDSETAPADADVAELLDRGRFDALLIGLKGAEFVGSLRSLRASFDLPIAVLTPDSSEAQRIEALDAGADQVLAKPITPGELVARLRALLRRTAPPGASVGLVLDPAARAVSYLERAAELTPTEFAILECLILKKDIILSRAEIADHVRGSGVRRGISSLEAIVSKVRRKLRHIDYPDSIVGVRGQGWVFRNPCRE